VLRNLRSNCGGGFTLRPIGPATEWRPGLSVAQRPPSPKRHSLSFSLDEVLAYAQPIKAIPPAAR